MSKASMTRQRRTQPRQAMSVEVRVVNALRALLADLEAACQNSYTGWNHGRRVWNDEVWKAADARSFHLCQKARRALATWESRGR